jgi:hypothetical protein
MLVISTSSGTGLGVPCQAGGEPDTSHKKKKKKINWGKNDREP